jgi:uncharacterized protein DUF3365
VRTPLKVNLILLMAAAIVIELFAFVSTPFLENIARSEVLQKARIMMEAAAGIRAYTSNEIAPLLKLSTNGDKFHPQTVPAYAASKNFALLASKFVDYAYREAALNPINPLNRAVDWEADIISDFRRHPDKRELITERETHNGRVLNLSHPIVSGGPCLACHGMVDKAPKAMIAVYGTQSGFGWKMDEVVGAQIVAVPMAVALEQSTRIRNMFVGVLAGVFMLLIGLLNALPIIMRTLFLERRPRAAEPQPVRAFGYGLIVSGVGVVVIAHAVVYAREGIAGLEKALDPFVLGNYISLAAVVPGMLTLWLARYLDARSRSGGLDAPAGHPGLGPDETARWEETPLWDETSLREVNAGR